MNVVVTNKSQFFSIVYKKKFILTFESKYTISNLSKLSNYIDKIMQRIGLYLPLIHITPYSRGNSDS